MWELTKEEIKRIRDNSPYAIPLDAYANGWTQPAIRQALGHSVCGEHDSVLSVVKDKVYPCINRLREMLDKATILLIQLTKQKNNVTYPYTYEEEKKVIDEIGDTMGVGNATDFRPIFASGKWFHVLYTVEYDMVDGKERGMYVQWWFKNGKILTRRCVFRLGHEWLNENTTPKKEWTEWADEGIKQIEQVRGELNDNLEQYKKTLTSTLPKSRWVKLETVLDTNKKSFTVKNMPEKCVYRCRIYFYEDDFVMDFQGDGGTFIQGGSVMMDFHKDPGIYSFLANRMDRKTEGTNTISTYSIEALKKTTTSLIGTVAISISSIKKIEIYIEGISDEVTSAAIEKAKEDIDNIKSRLGRIMAVVFQQKRDGNVIKYKTQAAMAQPYFMYVKYQDFTFTKSFIDDEMDISFSGYDCKTNRMYYAHIVRDLQNANEGFFMRATIEEFGYLDMATMQKTVMPDVSDVYVVIGTHYI